MLFLIEAVAACAAFTLMIELMIAKRRTAFVNDYPPVVTAELRKKGLIAEKPPTRKSDIIRKAVAICIYAILFALLLRRVNGITTFWTSALTAYALWLIVDWYDFLVIDILLAPFDKFYKASGVSAFNKSAVLFHCKASLVGTLLGLIFALLVGGLILIL